MKFDKESVIIIILAVLFLAGWYYFAGGEKEVQTADVQQSASLPAASPAPAAGTPAQTPAPAVKKGTPAPAPAVSKAPPSLKPEILENKLVKITVNPVTGSVKETVFKGYKNSDGKGVVTLKGSSEANNTFQITLPPPWFVASWGKCIKNANSLSLTRIYSDGKNSLSLTQVFSLAEDSYLLKCHIALKNLSKDPVVLPALQVWDAGVPPLKYLAGDTVYNDPHHIEYSLTSSGKLTSVSPSLNEEKFKAAAVSKQVDWIGSSNKYFATILVPKKPFDGGAGFARTATPIPDDPGENYYTPQMGGIYRNVTLLSGTPAEYTFEWFAGPKSVEEVGKLPETAIGVLHLSYFSFMEFLARPLVRLLKYLKELCGSYGIAIILLTIIVRVVFWPVTQKANNSMRKMQKINPLVKELREKYKDNPQLMNQKLMELYRTEKVNPLGGCLPILLQIPVFLALYSALDAAVELRHVSFLWATDLTKPDLVGPAFLFGYGIHPLILIMTALMVWQQKMTPAAGMDPIQQKMMMAMPVVMLIMLYNLPSGLTLYWTVSQIFSILQMKYTQYIAKKEEEKEKNSGNALPPKNA